MKKDTQLSQHNTYDHLRDTAPAASTEAHPPAVHTHTQPIRRKPTQREGGLKGKEINCYFQTSDKGKHKRDTFIILKCDYAKLL